jgi:hypothetical protein
MKPKRLWPHLVALFDIREFFANKPNFSALGRTSPE